MLHKDNGAGQRMLHKGKSDSHVRSAWAPARENRKAVRYLP